MEILQTRIPEGVAVPSSRGSSQPRDWTLVSYVSCFGRRVFSTSATYNSCLNKAYAPRIFSMRHITAFPHAGTWEALQSCMWGSFLNSKSCTPLRKKKKKKNKNATTRHEKNNGHLFAEWDESEDLSWATQIVIWACLPMSTKMLRVLIWGLQIHFSK